MTKPSKPILHNGYELNKDVLVLNRVEKVFFTEVYRLSNNSYLYLFVNLKMSDIRGGQENTISISHQGTEYLGIITTEHSQEHVTNIIESLTHLKGFDSVAGMRELKDDLIQNVISPLQQPEKYEKFKLTIPNGVLLYGPPGCGKTFIVRKLAEELGYNFMEIKHSDVTSSYMHGTVDKVARLFEVAKAKAPSIVFIDEIEGLIPRRETIGTSSQYKQEEINEFLMQFNDAGKNNVLVIAATNRPHLIDTALLRAGRMDKRIMVSPPDDEARIELFKLFFSERPTEEIDYERLSQLTEYYVSADIELIATEAAREALGAGRDSIDQGSAEKAIARTAPSVSEKEMEYFTQFKYMERR